MSSLSSGASRESLIQALNNAMKDEQELPDVKVRISNFDPSTGTFYCGNDKIECGTLKMKEACAFFEGTEKFYQEKTSDPEAKKKAEYCQIARAAIQYLLASRNESH